MSEVRKLSLHPLAIHTFIKAQAGSLGKALSEAVMNSLDAFATTVEVSITGTGFTIKDNGQGFRDRDEISAWFETLGFPHDDGNHRIYGKFGMGRAQQWAFARTKWTSNQFVMRVDVKNKGLDYELDHAEKPFNGTLIEAEFYEPLTFQAQQQVEIELENLVKFVPGTVLLNSKVVNKDAGTMDWDLETNEAWFKFDKNVSALSVYNAGLLVSHFPKYRYGCTGIVCTKPAATLSLNLARNSILESECKVWAKIVKSLPKTDSDYARAKPKPVALSASEKRELVREHLAGTWSLTETLKKEPKLLLSVTGRPIKLYELRNGVYDQRPVVVAPKGDDFGKRLSKLRLAHVVATETLQFFGCANAAEFKALVLKDFEQEVAQSGHNWYERQLDALREAVWSDDPQKQFPEFAKGKQLFAYGELQPAEKAVLYAWQKARHGLYGQVGKALAKLYEPDGGEFSRLYSVSGIALGDSPTDLSWVDTAAHTWVLRKSEALAAMPKALPVLTRYATARLREFCVFIGGGEDQGQKLFIQVISETEALGVLMLSLTKHYVSECRSQDIEVPKTKLSELETLNVE